MSGEEQAAARVRAGGDAGRSTQREVRAAYPRGIAQDQRAGGAVELEDTAGASASTDVDGVGVDSVRTRPEVHQVGIGHTRATDAELARLDHVRSAGQDQLLERVGIVIALVVDGEQTARTEDGGEVGQPRHVNLGLEIIVLRGVAGTHPEVGTVHVEVTATDKVRRQNTV